MRLISLLLGLAALPSARATTGAKLFEQTMQYVHAGKLDPAGAAVLGDAYARRGLRRSFALRQLKALIQLREPMSLKMFDLAGEEFREFARADPNPALRHLDQHDGGLGGISYITLRDGLAHAVIAVDPASRVHAFADTMTEEILHLRLHHHWASLDFGDHTPFIFTEAGLGLRHLLDELIAKELLAVYGRGHARDREFGLAELLGDVERRPERGIDGFVYLAMSLVWCADYHETSWRQLPLPRLLYCVYVMGEGGPGALAEPPRQAEVEALIRTAYAVNQRLHERVKTPFTAADD